MIRSPWKPAAADGGSSGDGRLSGAQSWSPPSAKTLGFQNIHTNSWSIFTTKLPVYGIFLLWMGLIGEQRITSVIRSSSSCCFSF